MKTKKTSQPRLLLGLQTLSRKVTWFLSLNRCPLAWQLVESSATHCRYLLL